MTSPSIPDLLKYVNLQVAAEAFLRDPNSGLLSGTGSDLIKALTKGNNHTSKFTLADATDFANHWVVLDQIANTGTGFSGTFFKNKDTNELVISMRSTEFIDDAARDNQATNAGELSTLGWAFGQTADMNNWYKSLRTNFAADFASAQGQFTVTGYSLGGALATSFDLMRLDEGPNNSINATYTFNGAGVGILKNGKSLTDVINNFQNLRTNGSASKFTDPVALALYNSLSSTINGKPAPNNVAQMDYLAKINAAISQVNIQISGANELNEQQTSQQLNFLVNALQRVKDVVKDALDAPKLSSGTNSNISPPSPATTPLNVPINQIDGTSLNYQLAVIFASQDTTAATGVIGNGWQGVAGRPAAPYTLPNFYDVYGDTSPSAVSNSQLHYGTPTPVFIQDQPLARGTVVFNAAIASAAALDTRLLVNNYALNDFGDTHSIVLQQDSLSVQNMLAQLDSTLTLANGSTILNAASNVAQDKLFGTQGTADGTSLDNLVNTLGKVFGVDKKTGWTNLVGDNNGGTWAIIDDFTDNGKSYTGRDSLHNNLSIIANSSIFLAMKGNASIRPSSAALAGAARNDFGALMSLLSLSPVWITGKDAAGNIALNAAWQTAYPAQYKAWSDDKSTANPTTYTDQWIQDRSAMLNALNYRNTKNYSDGSVIASPTNATYQDITSNQTVTTGGGTVSTGSTLKILFADNAGDTLIGGNSDVHLYGGSGNDTLNIGNGNDYLEGGAGNDVYNFASIFGKDTIVDSDGIGSLTLGGEALTGGKFTGSANTWSQKLANGDIILYKLVDSGTSKQLVISKQGSGGTTSNNSITINNFDASKAFNSKGSGYLGIKLPGQIELAPNTTRPVASTDGNGPTDATVTAIGDSQTFTVFAATDSTTAQIVTVKVSGGSGLLESTGSTTTLVAGSFDVTIPAGQDSVTVTLIEPNSSPAAQVVNLTATVKTSDPVDPNDPPPVSNALAITFNGTPTTTTPTDVIQGIADPNSKIISYFGNHHDDLITTSGGGQNVIDGAEGNDSITAGSGNDTISTSTGNSTIAGGNGQDLISTGNGNNQIYAGSTESLGDALSQVRSASNAKGSFIDVGDGNNTIVGGTGNDAIIAGSGNNTIVCGPGAVTVYGGVETSHLSGDWSNTSVALTGNAKISSELLWTNVYFTPAPFNAPANYEGSTLVTGVVGTDASGATLIPVGIGNDTIYGGTGNSVFDLSNGNNYLDAGGGNDFIQAGVGQNTIFGGSGNDTIRGGGGNNYIDAESGNDWIVGQGGNVTIFGGTGNDTIFSGEASADSATSHKDGSGYLVAGSGNTQLVGAGGSDTLIGGSGKDSLFAGDGIEYLEAGTGDTYMQGGAGQDTLLGGAGKDTMNAGSGDQLLQAGTGDTVMHGDVGKDTLLGGSGKDTIFAGSGDQLLQAGTGDTQMTGGAGNDTIIGGSGTNLITGGSGTTVISAGNGGTATAFTQVKAGSGNTTITGGSGIDNLIAGSGTTLIMAGDGGTADNATSVQGGSGTDTMVAGAGNDVFFGGTGHSTYQINSGAGTVTIYKANAGDTLQFGAGNDVANTTVTAVTYSNGVEYDFALNGGGVVRVAYNSSLTQATFGDGTVASFTDLVAGQFASGGTDYSATDYTLPTSSGGGSTTHKNLTLTGNGNLTGTGNSQDNLIKGNHGNDTLIGGGGNDTLVSGGGNNMYVVGAGVQTTTIQQSGAGDTLSFGTGVTVANLSATASTASDGSTNITITNSQGGSVVVNTKGNPLDQIVFADGSTASLGTLLSQATTGSTVATSAVNVTLPGGVQNMTLTGSANLTATGNSLDDVITANSGNDTLIAGSANDTLIGGAGATTYVVNGQGGNVTINKSSSADTLVFGAGILESNLTVSSAVVNGSTVTTISEGFGRTITINGGSLNQLQFANGDKPSLAQLLSPSYTQGTTTYSKADVTAGAGITTLELTGSANITATANGLNDLIQANSGNDTLIAGTGNDTLIGGGGSNTYVVSNGTQVTTVNQSGASDTLSFGAGVTLAKLSATAATAADGSTNITIVDSLGGSVVVNTNGYALDQMVFADKSTASLGALLAQATTGSTAATSAANVTLAGGIQNMLLTGSGNLTATGNNLDDVITANSGNDTLIAGSANDTLVGGTGATTYNVNAQGGNVTINKSSSADTLVFGTGILLSNLTVSSAVVNGTTVVTIANSQGGTVTINGGSLNKLQFANGDAPTVSQLLSSSYTSGTTLYSAVSATAGAGITTLDLTGSANISGTANSLNDVIQANSGNDTLNAGTGNDTLISGGGKNTYVVSNGAQTTTINKSGNTDTLSFGTGVTATNLSATAATAADGSTNITVKNSLGGTVVLNTTGNPLDTITFADGSTGSLGNVLAHATTGITAATSATSVTLAGGIQNMTLTGTANLTATANNLADVITANSGNDTLIAGTGNDTLAGGGGTATYDVNMGNGVTTINNSKAGDTLQFGTGITASNLTATSAVVGGVTVTTIAVSNGNNVIVNGGALDQIKFSDGSSASLSQMMTAKDSQNSSTNATLAGGLHNLVLTGSGNISGTANSLDDVITANSGNDTLVAGSGNDTLNAGSGNDSLVSGLGNVTMVSGNATGTGTGSTTFVDNGNLNVVTYSADPPTQQITITAGPKDTLQLGPNTLMGEVSVAQVNGNWVLTTTTPNFNDSYIASQVTVKGPLGNLALPDGTVIPFASYVNGSYVDGGIEYTNVSTTVAPGITRVNLTGSSNIAVTGNNLDDVIANYYQQPVVLPAPYGSQPELIPVIAKGQNTLIGGSGHDTLIGAYNDIMIGGSGATMFEGRGLITQSSSNDAIYIVSISLDGDTCTSATQLLQAYFIDHAQPQVAQLADGTWVLNLDVLNPGVDGLPSIALVPGNKLTRIVFADGSSTTVSAVLQASGGFEGLATMTSDTSVVLPGNFITLTLTGSANISGTGNNTFDDVITANSGNDTLIAGTRNDTLKAGTGIDVLVAGVGNDVLDNTAGGTATYQVHAGDGLTKIVGSTSADTLQFGTGISASNVTATSAIVGLTTVTTISVNGNPSVVVSGGALSKISFVDGGATTLSALLGGTSMSSAASAVMGAGITTLTLTGTANISGTGNNLADTIVANSGNDTLIAGSGIATLIGGSGNDTFVVNNVADVVNAANHIGNSVQTSVSYTTPTNVQSMTAIGSANVTLVGGSGTTLIANSGNDTLVDGGNDTLVGGAGATTYEIDSPNSNVTINNSSSADTLFLDASFVRFGDLTATSAVVGGVTVTTLTDVQGGRITINGGGLSQVNFSDGKSTTLSQLLSPTYSVGATSYSSVSTTAGTGITTLNLTGRANIVGTANSLNDSIQANSGNDTLVAGSGNDTLSGCANDTNANNFGTGFTTYSVGTPSGVTTIVASRTGDTLQFGSGIALANLTATASGTGLKGNYNVTISDSKGQAVVINDCALDRLTFADGSTASLGALLAQATTGSTAATSAVGGQVPTGIQNMTLTGTANVAVQGNASYNVITANSGNDTLQAGTGSDTLVGSTGATTYEFDPGAGVTTINKSTSADTLLFGTGIALSDLSATSSVVNGVTVVSIAVDSAGSSVVVNGGALNKINFAGGGSTTISALLSSSAATSKTSSVSTVMGTGVTRLTLTGTGNISGTGNTLSDVIVANNGNDTLIAGTGLATLVGGLGNNTFVVNNYQDVVIAQSGATSNTVQTSVDYTPSANIQNVVATGSGNVNVALNYSNMLFTGNSGNDTVTAGANNDTMVAGTGDDTFSDFYSSQEETFVINAGSGHTTITSNNTSIFGDTLQFGTGITANNLTASTAIVNGWPAVIITLSTGGTVTVNGGTLNRVVFADGSTSTLNALITGKTGATYMSSAVNAVMGTGITTLTLTGSANISGTGNNLADTIIGNSGNDTLIAGSGLATLKGGTGYDTFVVNNTKDVVQGTGTILTSVSYTAPANSSTATNTTSIDHLTGTGNAALALKGSGGTVVTANSGNDTLTASTNGGDTLVAGVGNNTLVGAANSTTTYQVNTGDGTTTINNSNSNDKLVFASTLLSSDLSATSAVVGGVTVVTIGVSGSGNVIINGGQMGFIVLADGTNIPLSTLLSNTAANSVTSAVSTVMGPGITTLTLTGSANISGTGNNLADTIIANSGNDTLIAGTGNDTLVAGTGNDILQGGSGITTYAFNTGDGLTTINSSGSADTLQFGSGITAANLTATSAVVGGVTVTTLAVSSGGSVVVNGGSLSNVRLGDGTTTTLAALVSASAASVSSAVSTVMGAGVTKLTLTGTANISGTGNTLADTIIANSGNDTLIAGSGLATLVGGTGADTFVVNNVGDVVTAQSGATSNTVQTTVSYVAPANVTKLTGTGSAAITLTANTLADTITANSGNDTLVAGTGSDTLVGGGGTTTYQFNSGNGNATINNSISADTLLFGTGITAANLTATSAVVNGVTVVTITVAGGKTVVVNGGALNNIAFAGGGTTTVAALLSAATSATSSVSTTMAAGITKLTLTGTGNISGTGNNLADTIIANSGNDTLIAGSGLATLVGGTGADTFVVNNVGDVVTAQSGATSNTVQTTVSYVAPANVTKLTGTGSAAITLTGNNLSNTITANTGNDTLIAGSGLATLVGGTGANTFVVNNASDVVTAQSGATSNTVQTTVSYVAPANVKNITGTGSAAITLTGNTLADVITANTGNDTLVAGSGLATLVGGTGANTFVVNNVGDVVTAQSGATSNTVQSSVSYVTPANVQNITGTGSAAITLTANALNDTITANAGNDTLIAGTGNDTLVGSTGTTTYQFNTGDGAATITNSISADTLKFGTGITASNLSATSAVVGGVTVVTITVSTGGSVIVKGGALSKVVLGDGSTTTLGALTGGTSMTSAVSAVMGAGITKLTLTGTANISGTGNNLADTIIANSGNDTLIAGSGLATLVGGAGNDTFVINNVGDVVTEATNTGSNLVQTSVSYVTPANVQNITGTGTAALTLTGNNLSNIITANSGADTLIAGTGVATLVGGTGADVFVVNNASDVVTAQSGATSNTVQTSVSYVTPANVKNLTGTGSAAITLTGNSLADVITANSGNDTLIAGSGLATLIGGAGNDTFVINNASDVITEGTNSGNNTEQTSVSVTLAANVQNLTGTGTAALTLTGNNLTNVITANSGADKLVAGSGTTTLVSGTGIDTLVGGTGANTFVVTNVSDVVTAQSGATSNTVQTSVSYVTPANVKNLTGLGTANLTLTANTLADVITANAGNDTLVAGTGNDTLVGSTGTTTYQFNTGNGATTINSSTSNDTLKFGTGITAANLTAATAVVNGVTVVTITVSSGGSVVVNGGALSKISFADGSTTTVAALPSAGTSMTSAVSAVMGTGITRLTLTGTANISGTGNNLADTIIANSGNDTLIAGTGLATLVGGTGADVFVVNNAADVVTAQSGATSNTVQTSVSYVAPANVKNLTGTGSAAITLTGNTLADVITANTSNDTLIAGAGLATLIGGTGSNTFVVNNASDVITAQSGAVLNTEQSSVSVTAATNVTNLTLTGTSALTGTANSGNDLLIANSGADTLVAGSGTDVLQGGAGASTLKDLSGNGAMLGGAGNEVITGGTGVAFIDGGAGADNITLGAGATVVAFNTGGGADTLTAGTGTTNVLSLGKGIAYANLTFSKSGNNLILNTGGSDSITFKNWYSSTANQDFVTLQVLEASATTYNAGSSNVLYNQGVETFDFKKLVTAFNAALAANPSLTSWGLMNSLLTDHLSGSNTAALGGDLAYYDGLNGNLTGLNLATATSTLQNASFGKTAQTVDAWSGVSTGNNRLQ